MTKRQQGHKVDGKVLASDIAAGRIKVRIGVTREPAEFADVASGALKAFQPSAWRAPAWQKVGVRRSGQKSGQCGYACDDPWQQAYAVQVMRQTGFNLPQFDLWLESQPHGRVRDALAIRRHQLCDALAQNDWVAVLYHVRDMAAAQTSSRDNKRQSGAKRGGKSAASVAKTKAAAWQEECAKAARELLQRGRTPRELAGILSQRFHVTPRQVRNALKLKGITQKNGN